MDGFIPHDLRPKLVKGIQELCAKSEGTIEFRQQLVQIAASLIPCAAPCSVVLADDFFSRGGRFATASHVNVEQVSHSTIKTWEAVLRRGNPIEQVLSSRANVADVGVARYQADIAFELPKLTRMAKKIYDSINTLKGELSIDDLMYGWIFSEHVDMNDQSYTQLLVICMRRARSEPSFTIEDAKVLSELVHTLKHLESYWFARPIAILTPTQQEVMELVRLGKSSKEIAYALGKDEGTIDNTILRVCHKLQANNRTRAAVLYEGLRKPLVDDSKYII